MAALESSLHTLTPLLFSLTEDLEQLRNSCTYQVVVSGHCMKLFSLYVTLNKEAGACLFLDTSCPCALSCTYSLVFLAFIAVCIMSWVGIPVTDGNYTHARDDHGYMEIIALHVPSVGAFTSSGGMSHVSC